MKLFQQVPEPSEISNIFYQAFNISITIIVKLNTLLTYTLCSATEHGGIVEKNGMLQALQYKRKYLGCVVFDYIGALMKNCIVINVCR